MSLADEQIRVSSTIKRELEERRREGESFNDVLERLLDDDRDLFAGAGFWTDTEADRIREGRTQSKEKSKERMHSLESKTDSESKTNS